MVDCGKPRCAQERRSFRKELISWGKKVPVLLAYEAIAGHLGGPAVTDEINKSFSGLETDTAEDFVPEKECIYCESKLASIIDIVGKLSDDAKKGRIDPDNAHLRYLQDLLPFCTQYYTHKKDDGEDNNDISNNNNNKSHIELKIPQLPQSGKSKKDILPNGKRAYTDDDLVSAVGDIRSGKIGTRRASTLYGIPRSTLRNKIFKMEVEDQSMDCDESNSVDEHLNNSMKLTDLMQAGSFAFLPPLPFLLPYQKETDLSTEEMEKKIEQLRHKHNIDGTLDVSARPAHINELKLPLLADLIQKLVEQRFQLECQKSASKNQDSESTSSLPFYNPYYSPLTAAYLSSLSSTENLDIRIPSFKSATPTTPNNINNNNDLSNKSKMYGKVYEEGRIGETLKDIIMKTITEKMRFRDGSDSNSETELSSSPLRSHLLSSNNKRSPQMTIPLSKLSNNHSPAKRSRKENDKKEVNPPNPNSLKKTRPKRGQYRKYNSALLMEAVRAVQRGEMSVHRAGSYYGVPHSTLEYKVKERHLLRQKKLRDAQPSKETKPTTSNIASTEKSSPLKSPVKKSESKSALSFTPGKDSSTGLPWYQPYINTNTEFKPDLNYFPSGFALSTPASELLRKLQHKVQSKTSPVGGDSASFELPTPNGSTNGEGFMLYN